MNSYRKYLHTNRMVGLILDFVIKSITDQDLVKQYGIIVSE
jgi:hypothetical protein